MGRVLDALESVRALSDADAVHDLRVALRRCRAVADTMQEVDADPGWRAVKRLSKKLFKALGVLRDGHVLRTSVEEFTLPDNPVRSVSLAILRTQEASHEDDARRAIDAFDRKAWKHLVRRMSRRAGLVGLNSAAAQCLALERYTEVRRLHARVVRAPTPERWHQLRIAVKHFRYVVEFFLPGRYAVWEPGLKGIQDLLGRLHDLHVLRGFVLEAADGQSTSPSPSSSPGPADADVGLAAGAAVSDLKVQASIHAGAISSVGQLPGEERIVAAVDAESQLWVARYRQRTHGAARVLRDWRVGLPRGVRVHAATAARLRVMARALDPRVNRTLAVSRLTLQLFDALAAAGADSHFRDAQARTVLRAAARVHGLRPKDERPRQKGASRVLMAAPAPVGWSAADWAAVAWTVRYYRGPEPKPAKGAFSRLPTRRQQLVCALAGVLRLAVALQRAGATAVAPGGYEATAGDLRLRVRGLVDHRKNAARIAAAKHLLDSHLQRQVIIDRG